MGRISLSYSIVKQLASFVGLTKQQINAAVASALNRSAVTARAEAVRIVREREKKVKASAARAQISIVKASPRRGGDAMRAVLVLKGGISLLAATKVRQVTIIAYAGRKPVPIFQGKGKPPLIRMMDGERKGVVVQGINVSDKAFLARTSRGKPDVFVRRGDGRLPIKALRTKGAIGPKFFEEPEVRSRIHKVFVEAYRKNIAAEVKYRKEKDR